MTLDADELEAEAKAETGLDDFGDGDHREGLERLVRSMNTEADLTETGELMQRIRLVSLLSLADCRSRTPIARIRRSMKRRSRGLSSSSACPAPGRRR